MKRYKTLDFQRLVLTPSSWRDLLKEVISDATERSRLAKAIGIHAVTLDRWSQGTSKVPRPHRLYQMVQVFPTQYQGLLIELLQQEYSDFQYPEAADQSQKIDYAFIQQIWEARATTPTHLQLWTLGGKILESALRQLDPQRRGMSITVALCMPPCTYGRSIRSLHEITGLGSPPWPPNLESYLLFLGAESLAGYVVSHGRIAFINDLSTPNMLLPTYRVEYEVSAAACPIMYANRVAGCLISSSTQLAHFASEERRSLLQDYTQLLTPVFPTDYFFEPRQIELQLMPPPQVQYTKFVAFQQRVNMLMKEAYHNASQFLTRPQVEQQVWQQIEEELLRISNPYK